MAEDELRPANDAAPPAELLAHWNGASVEPPPESVASEKASEATRPVPWSNEIELGVLGYLMLQKEPAQPLVAQLSDAHFYSGAHVALFRAIAAVAQAGEEPDLMLVAERLQGASAWGGPEGWNPDRLIAVQALGAETPARAAALVRRLDDLRRRRAFIEHAIALEARARVGQEPTEALLDAAQAAVAGLAGAGLQRAISVVDASEVSEELPEPQWLVEGLRIAPGAPVMIAGYGYSRKTLAAQALALSVAAGKRVWGMFGVRRGPVLHVDYEQGGAVTSARYVRLARGMGFRLSDLPRGELQFAALPGLYLDARGAEARLVAAATGRALIVVDSLRASAPSLDENASEVRGVLDMLGHVSARTGAAVVVIHHATKPTETRKAGSKESIRGSGALFDACGGVYTFRGEKGEPTRVKHIKERVSGRCVDDFGLDAEDVPHGSDPVWGLRVVHLEPEQVREAEEDASNRIDERAVMATCERVIAIVSAQGRASKRNLREAIRCARGVVDAAIERLVTTGRLRIDGKGPMSAYVLGGVSQ